MKDKDCSSIEAKTFNTMTHTQSQSNQSEFPKAYLRQERRFVNEDRIFENKNCPLKSKD